MWGQSYKKPATYMAEYLEALIPLLDGQTPQVQGELVTALALSPLEIPGSVRPPVLLAALGPVMLALAGAVATGTLTWMTGINTIREHIAPIINKAAKEAGRNAPRVGVALPVVVTSDKDRAKEMCDKAFSIYPTLPSYRAMLDKEGAARASDVGFIGTEDEVLGKVAELEAAGATDFAPAIVGTKDEQRVTYDLFEHLAKEKN
jgi:F420-dependent oxidoreductase-like protein